MRGHRIADQPLTYSCRNEGTGRGFAEKFCARFLVLISATTDPAGHRKCPLEKWLVKTLVADDEASPIHHLGNIVIAAFG